LCRKALNKPKKAKNIQTVRKLEEEHIDFLISKNTLQEWAGRTLK